VGNSKGLGLGLRNSGGFNPGIAVVREVVFAVGVGGVGVVAIALDGAGVGLLAIALDGAGVGIVKGTAAIVFVGESIGESCSVVNRQVGSRVSVWRGGHSANSAGELVAALTTVIGRKVMAVTAMNREKLRIESWIVNLMPYLKLPRL
jgi:hypothetical protein